MSERFLIAALAVLVPLAAACMITLIALELQ